MHRSIPLLLLFFVASSSVFGEDSAHFKVAPGLEVQSAVKSGLVEHPWAATLDDQGRLFVAERSDRKHTKETLMREKPGLIRMLVDRDQDGVFDHATLFADQLTSPQGALWIYDSLYVMSPPCLWRFSDQDDDGVADEREKLVSHFDFDGDGTSIHGPYLHPNGRLFWAQGRKGYSLRDNDTDEVLERGVGARIWSCSISGGDVETFASGGRAHPLGLDFTNEGELIGTANQFGENDRDVLLQWVYGGLYPDEAPLSKITQISRTGPLLPEIRSFGGGSLTTVHRYRSGAVNPDWQNQWLVANLDAGQITRTDLVRKGAGFSPIGGGIIVDGKPAITKFSDVFEDHQGGLLVIDHAGGIYRVTKKGQTISAPTYPDWNAMTAEAVSHLLDADEPWLRDRAGLQLAALGDPAIPEIKRILRDPRSTPLARQNAIWVLAKLRFSESTDLILAALKDKSPGVRQAAANAISITRTWQSVAANEPNELIHELERNRTISGALASIVRSDEPPVARQAAVALGRMAENRAVGAILGRLGRVKDDRLLEHSLIYALIEIDDAQSTEFGLESENPAVVEATLRALHAMPSANFEVFTILPHLDAEHPGLRKTAIALALQHPEWDAAIANRFFEWEELTKARIDTIQSVVKAFGDHPPLKSYIASLVKSESEERRALGQALSQGSQ